MKNNRILKLLLITLILSFTTACSSGSPYEKAVESFTPITFEETKENIANGIPFILYMGNDSCSFCIDVAPHVQQAAKREAATVYYLNTESPELEGNTEFEEFKKDYEVDTDPAMILFTQDGFERTSLMTDTDQTALIFKKYLKKINEN